MTMISDNFFDKLLNILSPSDNQEVSPNSLTFSELRQANLDRAKVYRNAQGQLVSDEFTPAQWLQALVGEIGEYANFRKKFERGDFDDDPAFFYAMAAKELADVQTYLDLLAASLDIDLGEATRNKFNEVSDRIGCKVYL